MKLPSVADLFTTQEQRDEDKRENVREIPLTEISDFPNHPFKVTVSIICIGILTEITVFMGHRF